MDSYLFDLTPQLLHDAVLSMIAVFTLFLVASHFLFNPVRDMLKSAGKRLRVNSAMRSRAGTKHSV